VEKLLEIKQPFHIILFASRDFLGHLLDVKARYRVGYHSFFNDIARRYNGRMVAVEQFSDAL
jgi:hypothetical protein